jgi:carboxyl-terminal processing protease
MQGMILDLRGNSGGYLEEASKFLGHFLKKGEITVKSTYTAFEDKAFSSKGMGELKNYPLVILVDQLTASAGEIIALTLQEQGAIIVGMPSFGKGSIQTVTELPDGSSIKYTVGKRYSPNNTSIDHQGITPDIEIPRDFEEYKNNNYDVQREKAKTTLINLIQ